jgi:sec-independent protein translocase protein TatA
MDMGGELASRKFFLVSVGFLLLYFLYPHGWITQGSLLRSLPHKTIPPETIFSWGGAMFGIGMGELILLCMLGLLLFGSQLPRMARSLGGTIAGFRREVQSVEEDVRLTRP